MKALEKEAITSGITEEALMAQAGRAVADEAINMLPHQAGQSIIVLCGAGNNGGDGLVAASFLAQAGHQLDIWLVSERKKSDPLLQAAEEAGAHIHSLTLDQSGSTISDSIRSADLLIDALLGTGAKFPLRPDMANALDMVQASIRERSTHLPVLAVDCPSGMDCDTGATAEGTLKADVTVTFGAVKSGLIIMPAAELTGSIKVANIGLLDTLSAWGKEGALWIDAEWANQVLPPRLKNSYKGTYGRVIITGGSINYPGAPLLAGKGAYQAGAGLVSLAVPHSIQQGLISGLPEATWIVLPEETGVIAAGAEDVLLPETRKAEVMVIGPGIGHEKSTINFIKSLLSPVTNSKGNIGFTHPVQQKESGDTLQTPMVVDADALRIIAGMDSWWTNIPTRSIVTPHPGEMAALTGQSKEEIQADRIKTAQMNAKKWQVVVVLKGAFTVIAGPDGRVAISPFATSALAHAGTGDVLAGVIGGFYAQGLGPWEAALLGVFVHGRAGELAAEAVGDAAGVLASEVAAMVPEAIGEIRNLH
jgi:ADP-dependent NAD(P)H-hydrate dehydratase / NAD(P)H-hydrate epimerase